MARNDLDDLLGALKAHSADVALDGLEMGVWARVEDHRRVQSINAGGLRTQLAVAVAALAIGAVVGGVTADHRPPARSEMVVLSEDAALTPSVAVEGGA